MRVRDAPERRVADDKDRQIGKRQRDKTHSNVHFDFTSTFKMSFSFVFEETGKNMGRNSQNFEKLVQQLLDEPHHHDLPMQRLEKVYVLKEERDDNYYDDLGDFEHAYNILAGQLCNTKKLGMKSDCFSCRQVANQVRAAKAHLEYKAFKAHLASEKARKAEEKRLRLEEEELEDEERRQRLGLVKIN